MDKMVNRQIGFVEVEVSNETFEGFVGDHRWNRSIRSESYSPTGIGDQEKVTKGFLHHHDIR